MNRETALGYHNHHETLAVDILNY